MSRAMVSQNEALKAVLESNTFRRADVLRAILEYLYEQESLGRGHAITEYDIGVHALGRPPNFSPETDSSVRTRMHALRRKLDEYYAGEGNESEVRLEVPRGTYALRFTAMETEPRVSEVPAPPTARWLVFVAGMAAALIALGLVYAGMRLMQRDPAAELERAAWGPLLNPAEPAVLALAAPLQLYLRDFGDNPEPVLDPRFRLPVPRTPELLKWYAHWRGRDLGNNAILHPNHHSPLWGDASAALVVTAFLARHSVHASVVPAYRTHAVALREKNAVLIGRAEYSDVVASLTPDEGFSVAYDPAERRVGVANPRPRQGEPAWWFASDNLRRNYGLITVLPSDTGDRHRTIIFAGINSDGAEAGAKFLTSANSLGELDRWFRNAGLLKWPAKFQVVVRTDSVDTYSLQTRFEAARVLP